MTAYAGRVLSGAVVASRLVRQACQRHVDDVASAGDKGLVWKAEAAQDAIDFFAEVLILPERTDAAEEVTFEPSETPRPFVLEPWQQFIVGSAFGWYTVQGFRRFREIYIETAKGSGKTPLGAGMMLYLTVADGERGAQVFCAATTRDQARYAYVDAERMVAASPHLAAVLEPTVNNLAFPELGSFLRAISSEAKGLDGKRVHGALLDELHEHPTGTVVMKMRAGTKGRRNAMIVKITNSGFDRTSVCWNHHEYSRKVLKGTVANETWFAFIAGLDPCQACLDTGRWFPADDCPTCDDWKTEGPHWLKANPNLGVSLPWQYVRERVAQAKGMPSEVSDVLRFNFCVWTQGASRAIDMGRWAACQALPSETELVQAPCFGCLDLGEPDDVAAWGRLWVLSDDRLAVKMRYFAPRTALERYPDRPYKAWQRAGLLTIQEDSEVIDYGQIREVVLEDAHALGLQSVFYDGRNAMESAQILTAAGVEMVKVTQGFQLNEAIKKLLALIVEGGLCHGGDPVLGWMASNTVVVTGTKGERRLDKQTSPGSIVGISALVMGIEGGIVRRERVPPPVYDIAFLGGRA